MQLILSLLTGLIVGAVFAGVKLPVPAPAVLPGGLGIVGIWLGAALVTKFIYSA